MTLRHAPRPALWLSLFGCSTFPVNRPSKSRSVHPRDFLSTWCRCLPPGRRRSSLGRVQPPKHPKGGYEHFEQAKRQTSAPGAKPKEGQRRHQASCQLVFLTMCAVTVATIAPFAHFEMASKKSQSNHGHFGGAVILRQTPNKVKWIRARDSNLWSAGRALIGAYRLLAANEPARGHQREPWPECRSEMQNEAHTLSHSGENLWCPHNFLQLQSAPNC